MPRLVLPTMVAGRSLADTLVDRVTTTLRDEELVVDCRDLVSASPSFAARLVQRVVVERQAKVLRAENAPRDFAVYLAEAAERLGVADHVVVVPAPAAV